MKNINSNLTQNISTEDANTTPRIPRYEGKPGKSKISNF